MCRAGNHEHLHQHGAVEINMQLFIRKKMQVSWSEQLFAKKIHAKTKLIILSDLFIKSPAKRWCLDWCMKVCCTYNLGLECNVRTYDLRLEYNVQKHWRN
mmetsp:Transcript_20684/g.36933  ORF Transcript_20684/g.36933 Transcript_20684/m.36933 type:complete len:100 (+) Transcript_20684:614-913(+)